MNAELFRKVADAIEAQRVGAEKVGLNMHYWHGSGHPCGTSACVAGYVELIETTLSEPISWKHTRIFAQSRLEIDDDQALELFHGDQTAMRLGMAPYEVQGRINRSEHLVPTALRWMADTGVVDWDAALNHACSVMEKRDET